MAPPKTQTIVTNLQSVTDTYWVPPVEFVARGSGGNAIAHDHHLGFWPPLPKRNPAPAGLYFGEGALPDRRELVFTPFTTMTGKISQYGGINPNSMEATFNREKFVYTV